METRDQRTIWKEADQPGEKDENILNKILQSWRWTEKDLREFGREDQQEGGVWGQGEGRWWWDSGAGH